MTMARSIVSVVVNAALLSCAVSCAVSSVGFGQASVRGFVASRSPVESVYGRVDLGRDLDKPMALIRSALHPAWMMSFKSSRVECFTRQADDHDWAPPSFAVVKTRAGSDSVRRGQSIEGRAMTRPWVIVSWAGAEGFEYYDAPFLLVLQHRPTAVEMTDAGLSLSFARDAGWVAAMPLFGYMKLPQEGSPIREYPCVQRGTTPWTWDERLPDDVAARADWWSRTVRAYPVAMRETFSVNDVAESLTIRQDYEYLTTRDDWRTSRLKFAAIPPTLAMAIGRGTFPVYFSSPIHDPELMTPFGPLKGALGVDRLDATYDLMTYVHNTERMKLPPADDPVAGEALAILRGAMAKRFASADSWRIDFGKNLFCWAIMSDYWYPYGLPYLDDPEVTARAKGSLRKYYDEYVLRRERFDPHRGKLMLHGPGIGSWGSWGDAGKFSSNMLRSIWAYAHFTGDWGLIEDRWGIIKRLFITPEEMSWTCVGRVAIAEMGDEAPPCLAMARMAYAVGDTDQYHFASYCYIRELVHHYVKSHGSEYFYTHQPLNRMEPMPRKVFPSNIWGTTAGWQVDGPHYPRKHGERQYTNRWVRFHCFDTARFYRDYLRDAVEWELTDPEIGWGHWAGRYNRDDSHIMTSYIRVRSMLLEDSPEKLSSIVPPSCMRVYEPSGTIAPMIAFMRTASPRETDRVIPRKAGASPFVAGLERSAERMNQQCVAMDYYGSYPPTPVWWKWGIGRRKHRSFGGFDAFPGAVRGFTGHRRLSYVSELNWFEPVAESTVAAPSADETEWLCCGPFPDPEDDGLTLLSYEPETRTDLAAAYRHGDMTAQWKSAPRVGGGKERGRFDLEGALLGGAPKGGKLGYLLCHVRADRPRRAVLSMGNAGGVRAFVNGEQVYYGYTNSKWRSARVTVGLKAGWNRVLVKVGTGWGKWRPSVELSDADGTPLEGVEFSARPVRSVSSISSTK